MINFQTHHPVCLTVGKRERVLHSSLAYLEVVYLEVVYLEVAYLEALLYGKLSNMYITFHFYKLICITASLAYLEVAQLELAYQEVAYLEIALCS